MSLTKAKIGPNERCPCASGLKYKKCCFRTDQQAKISLAQQFDAMLTANERAEDGMSSERLQDLCTHFTKQYDTSSIDITNIVTELNLNKIHGHYGGKNLVLLCERNAKTESVFLNKGAKTVDQANHENIMVTYKNGFLQFNYDTEKEEALNELHKWFKNKKSMARGTGTGTGTA